MKNFLFITLLCFVLQPAWSADNDFSESGNIEVNQADRLLSETELPIEEPDIQDNSDIDLTFSRENFSNPLIRIDTNLGTMVLELFPQEAPETVANFIGLAEGTKPFQDPYTGLDVQHPFYDGLIFHRVIEGFMIQGGSPNFQGDGTPGYSFPDEINARSLGLDKMEVLDQDGIPHPYLSISSQEDFQNIILRPLYQKMGITSSEILEARLDEIDQKLRSMTVKESYENLGYQYLETVISRKPVRGVIAMANSGPNTNGSQFFINLVDTDWLTGKHTVFGKVRSGLEVLDAIGQVRVDAQSRPIRDITIESIRVIQE